MDFGLLITLFVLGGMGGFLSGLLGIGGGIIMVPLLLYVPPVLGVGALTMKTVAGITSVQSLAGAVSGAVGHQRHRRISLPLTLTMGISMGLGALGGSIWSKFLSSEILLMVFACMALAAAVMMLIPRPAEGAEVTAEQVTFSRTLTILTGGGIGLLSGIIGQGGAFLFIPAMLYILRIPTRIAIGSALAIGIISSVAVLAGRGATNQIPYLMSIVLVLGVILGAQVGSALSQKTPRKALTRILAVLIGITAIKIWYEILIIS